MELLILSLVFIGTVGVIVGAWVFVNRRRLAAAEAARARLRPNSARPATAPSSILKDERASSVPMLDRLLKRLELTPVLERELQLAGSGMKPGFFLLLVAVSAVSGLMLGTMLTSGGLLILWIAGGAAAPLLWLRQRKRARRAAFEAQLPDAIDMLVSAMQAGYSFPAAMRFIGDELPAPLGPEFGRTHDEHRFGVDMRTALLNLQDRIESEDLKMLVTAVLIQRETGGSLGEVLTNIADVMRQRFDMRRQIQTLTAESKLSARILAALPAVVFFAVALLDPRLTEPMLQTDAGRLMLGAAALSVSVGYLVMMRIADVEM